MVHKRHITRGFTMRNKVAKALRRIAKERDTPYKVIKKLFKDASKLGKVK